MPGLRGSRVGGVPTDEGVFGTGPLNESIVGVLVRAAVTGRDTSAPAGTQNVPVEARAVSGWNGTLLTQIILGTASHLLANDVGGGFQGLISADTPSIYAAAGRSAASPRALWANALAVGIDNTGAAVLRPVEARDFTTSGDVGSSLIGLTTNSRLSGFTANQGPTILQSLEDTGQSGILSHLVTIPSRESGYFTSIRERRFSFTHQTPGTLITAQATFVATTPTLLLYNSAGNATTIVLRTVRVTVLEATTAPVFISVAIDTADRFSAGGTVITGQNWNEASAVAYPGTAFRFNATATAAGAGTRYLWTDAIPAGIGGSITISFRDGVVVTGVGSILVYLWDSAGLNGADIVEDIEVEAY
jgi:hypothetical protein